MKNLQIKIDNLFTNTNTSAYDKCYVIVNELMKDENNKFDIFKYALRNSYNMRNAEDNETTLVDIEAAEEIEIVYYKLLDGIVTAMIHKNYDEDDFYKSLYDAIYESDFFPKNELTQVVLLVLLVDRINLIPYFKVNSNECIKEKEFKEIISKDAETIAKIEYMVDRPFRYSTERAAQIYDTIEALQTTEEKIVMLSVLMQCVEKRVENDN